MADSDFASWMIEFARPGAVWYAKRLAANDTLATEAHQAGPYIPKLLAFQIFPELNDPAKKNPDKEFPLTIDSRYDKRQARVIWYNNKLFGGTRDETRITKFGGRKSAVLDPDSTGTIAVFAFLLDEHGVFEDCRVWVCRNTADVDLIEERLGPIEPKSHVIWTPGVLAAPLTRSPPIKEAGCRLSPKDIPPDWLSKFPSGEEIIRATLLRRPRKGLAPDKRLVSRRRCEYEIFQSVEEAYYLPKIKGAVHTLDTFVGLAQSILQSRKSRSGNSLELHAREIMSEEGLVAGVSFSHRPVIEGGKKPDFLFPTKAAYETKGFPTARLRMLAAKTTCKDRWRQVLNEADRIREKHLLTLQEGVSEGQFREMSEAGVRLVVPLELHKSYPKSVRPKLISLSAFIREVAGL